MAQLKKTSKIGSTPGEFIERVDFEQSYPLDAASKLLIDVTGAKVAVIGTDSLEAVVRLQWGGATAEHRPQVRVVGGQLEVVARKLPPILARGGCNVVEVHIPHHLQTTVTCWAGAVWLEGLSGNVNVTLGTGSMEGHAPIECLDINCGAGGINLQGLKGSARLKLGVGSANLGWQELASEDQLKLAVGLGSIALDFPVDAQVQPQKLKSFTSARLANAVGASIKASIGLGDIEVQPSTDHATQCGQFVST